ncbi:MAG: diadenylate cyclase CdaA [Lachnospiraceae bacterium]|jgi:diadenylate cyclase
MSIWENIVSYFNRYFSITKITVTDIIEIVIIAFLFYEVMAWFKRTRAWALFKGILIVLIVVMVAAIFQLNTILWLASKTINVGVIGVIIIFQPELRRALEQLGRGKVFNKIFGSVSSKQIISDRSIDELLEAVETMSLSHTGALICIEKDIGLGEFEIMGIKLDSLISKQLLVNIFVDKTPLHDGAVIIRSDRVVAATCYLPLSDNLDISKHYGTRHRAALGLSEVTDALAIVVSEETGRISVASGGVLEEGISYADLKNKLLVLQGSRSENGLISKVRKGMKNNEAKADTSEMGGS